MNTERNGVETNAIIVIDKIAKASELNELTHGFDGDVVITKKLFVDKNVDISCNLYVLGGIARKNLMIETDININGDFYCYGEIHCNNINVSGYFYSKKPIYARDIRVAENFTCDDKIDVYGHDIIVAGDFKCKGVVAEEVRVLGEASINGSTSVSKSIKTGY